MKKPATPTASKPANLQTSLTSDAERLGRLASSAIKRGQTKALHRYLALGLDPNSSFYDGWKGSTRGSLVGEALRSGDFEFFDILYEAGAKVSNQDIANVITWHRDTRVLEYLIGLKLLDCASDSDGLSQWIDFASGWPIATLAKAALIEEACRREREALGASVAPHSRHRSRNSL